jgi:hypothetical protein
MSKLLHVRAFEYFSQNIPNELKAFVAFGLFMEAERKWASGQKDWPSETKYRGYHQNYLTPHQTDEYRDAAERVLINFSNNVVAETLTQYKGHTKFRWWGIVEAVIGAFIWSILLIALTIIAQRIGVDILEVYKRLAGVH